MIIYMFYYGFALLPPGLVSCGEVVSKKRVVAHVKFGIMHFAHVRIPFMFVAQKYWATADLFLR